MIKNVGNVDIIELFSYDMVCQPSYVNATVSYSYTPTRSQMRKTKIIKIIKNHTYLV